MRPRLNEDQDVIELFHDLAAPIPVQGSTQNGASVIMTYRHKFRSSALSSS